MRYILNRLKIRAKRDAFFKERFFEPLHLHVAAFFVLLFGSYRKKIAYDLIPRPQYAAGLLEAADRAVEFGVSKLVALEFGVAHGAGLINMARIAERISQITGVEIAVHGFDTGKGMPEPTDYRDHPEIWKAGDFPMNEEALRAKLPPNANLIIGDVSETVPEFLDGLADDEVIGFVAIDVDTYTSTKGALKALADAPTRYLPSVPVFLDDIWHPMQHSRAGEMLAVKEFNDAQEFRVIEYDPFYEVWRYFRRPRWIKHMHHMHVIDHPVRQKGVERERIRNLENPYT